MSGQSIVILILAAVALVTTLAIINSHSVVQIGRPRPDRGSARPSEPVPPPGRTRRLVRVRRRPSPGSDVPRVTRVVPSHQYESGHGYEDGYDGERYAEHDPRFVGPPPADPWYARGWRPRLRRRIQSSTDLPMAEHAELPPMEEDDGTGNPPADLEPERLRLVQSDEPEDHDRLI